MEKYRKPVQEFNKAKELVDQQIGTALEYVQIKESRREMANKVLLLMKIKIKLLDRTDEGQ